MDAWCCPGVRRCSADQVPPAMNDQTGSFLERYTFPITIKYLFKQGTRVNLIVNVKPIHVQRDIYGG